MPQIKFSFSKILSHTRDRFLLCNFSLVFYLFDFLLIFFPIYHGSENWDFSIRGVECDTDKTIIIIEPDWVTMISTYKKMFEDWKIRLSHHFNVEMKMVAWSLIAEMLKRNRISLPYIPKPTRTKTLLFYLSEHSQRKFLSKIKWNPNKTSTFNFTYIKLVRIIIITKPRQKMWRLLLSALIIKTNPENCSTICCCRKEERMNEGIL